LASLYLSAPATVSLSTASVRAFDVARLPPRIVTDWQRRSSTATCHWMCRSTSTRSTCRGPSYSSTRAETPWSHRCRRQDGRWRSSRSLGCGWPTSGARRCQCAWPCRWFVRAGDQRTLERRTKRLKQRARDLGAEVRLLRWEQRAGWLAVAPLRRPPLSRRGQPVETGTVARTYPFSAGTLAIEGGGPVRGRGQLAGDLFGRAAAQGGAQGLAAHLLVRRSIRQRQVVTGASATCRGNTSRTGCACTASTRTRVRNSRAASAPNFRASCCLAAMCRILWVGH